MSTTNSNAASNIPLDSLNQITAAVDADRRVHWMNDRYTVVKDRHGRYLVGWDVGGRQENWTGLCLVEHSDMPPTGFYVVQP